MEERLSVFEQFMVLVKQTPGPALFWFLAVLTGVGLALAVVFEEIHRADARKAIGRARKRATPGATLGDPDTGEAMASSMADRQLAFNGSSPER